MRIVGVIPARLASTRLPEKVLRPIAGKPMLEHVWNRVCQAKQLSDVWIACDEQKVFDVAQGFGAKVMMTSADHPNGTSRLAEVAENVEADFFVNIQGDEPLIDPSSIDAVAGVLSEEVPVATLAVKKNDPEGYQDPNVVKVVLDGRENALYFSRASIPHYRDNAESSYHKHLGLYGYGKQFLLDFVKWPSSVLEESEKLEQLRILQQGVKMRVVCVPEDAVGVDTLEDLKKVEEIIKSC